MNPSQTLAFDQSRADTLASSNRARFFYLGAAALLFVLTFIGFQQFYLHGKAFPNRGLTPPIRTLLILHGTAMSAWMLLFLAQPLLIVAGNRRVHMMLGKVGAALAVCMVFLGVRVGIEAARVNPPDMRLWGLVPKQFMAIPLIAILMFAIFVILGVWNRRRPEVHRPMMLLAALTVIAAALDRIDAIRNLYSGTVWGTIFGPFFAPLAIGLLFLVVKWSLTRSWDRWYAMGYAGLVVAGALTMQLAPSQAWDHFASLLLR
ncbi:MAG: hypothetical protein ACM3TN_21615 [Alphaproteobacteria bacterium]